MTIKAVFFDIDGTLVDSNDMHVTAWRDALASAGADFSLQVVHDQIGKGADMLLPTLLPDLDEHDQDALSEAHGQLFKDRFLNEVKPFPRAHELLRRASEAGLQVVLASSASRSEVDHYLDLLDARELVSATTSADDVEHSKPAPDIFAHALRVAGHDPHEVVVVGDTPYDVSAARKCGIAAVGLRSGKFPDHALLGEGAIALYDDAGALLDGYDASPLAA